jgi:hypothetical protein
VKLLGLLFLVAFATFGARFVEPDSANPCPASATVVGSTATPAIICAHFGHGAR